MKKCILWFIGLTLFSLNPAFAEKKFVPILIDDLVHFATYYTTTNHLQIPTITYDNNFNDLVVQCEDDISYFVMAHHIALEGVLGTSRGEIVVQEEGVYQGDTKYLKGYVEGGEPVSITSSIYYNNELFDTKTKTCNSGIDDSAYPPIPNYPDGANSYGTLELNCQDDIVYYTLSYICFKSTVKLSVTANGNPTIQTEESKQGSNPFIYYEHGYYERGNSADAVEVVGTITGGNGGGPYRASCPQR